jgi:hypothetical protein
MGKLPNLEVSGRPATAMDERNVRRSLKELLQAAELPDMRLPDRLDAAWHHKTIDEARRISSDLCCERVHGGGRVYSPVEIAHAQTPAGRSIPAGAARRRAGA